MYPQCTASAGAAPTVPLTKVHQDADILWAAGETHAPATTTVDSTVGAGRDPLQAVSRLRLVGQDGAQSLATLPR